MWIFKKKKPDYEKLIKKEIERLESERLEYWNKAQSVQKEIVRGNMDVAVEIEMYMANMNNCTYRICTLRDILNKARA